MKSPIRAKVIELEFSNRRYDNLEISLIENEFDREK